MANASLNDVLLALGRVQEGVDRLTAAVAEDRSNARESRATIHSRLDEQAEQMARLETTVAVAGQVDAQMRDEVKALALKVDANQKEVKPAVDEWNRMKAIGIGIGGLLALGGLSLASMLMWFGEVFWNWLRHMLRIG